MDELTETERRMLEFERWQFKFRGTKETAVYEQFGMTLTRYYQVLGVLLEKDAAMRYDVHTVKRLLRLKEARRRARARDRS